MDLGGKSEHDVADSFLVTIFPILDFLLVSCNVFFRRCVFPSECNSSAVDSDVSRALSGKDAPLALRHEEALHGNGPGLIVGAGEDGDKGGEAGRHFLVRLVRG